MIFDWGTAAREVAISIPWIGLGAFFAFWVHRAQGNRALTMGLYIVFGALSFFGFLYGAGGLWRDYREGVELSRSGWTYMTAGFFAGLPLLPPTRRLLAKVIPFSPQSIPDMVGLIILMAAAAASAVQLFYSTEIAESPDYGALVQQLILVVAIAFLAVGTFVVRSPRDALLRLGLVVPTLRQVVISVLLVIPTFLAAMVASFLVSVLQPDVYDSIQGNLEEVTRNFQSVWGALAIGLTAGVGEELLFRGAIQPRYGIVFTALVFALLHIQYNASFILVGTFAAGVIFGIQRQRMNTSTAIITHALYNMIAVLLATYL